MKKKSKWKPWGDHPIIVAILVITALITTYVAVFGLPTIFKKSQLTIRVADSATGASISNAKVIVFSSDKVDSKYTDSNGSTTFEVGTKNSVRVIVETNDYQIYEREIQSINTDPIDLRLIPIAGYGADILLRTFDEARNKPVSGVEITLVINSAVYKQVSDSDGFARFSIIFPSNGEINSEISVNTPDFNFKNQIVTLVADKLQYILLSTDSLRVEIPNIPSSEETQPNVSTTSPPNQLNIVSGVMTTQEPNGSGLRVILLDPDSKPWKDVYVAIYENKDDASGNPSRGSRLKDGRINAQGILEFDLELGKYVVCTDNPPGYGWIVDNCVYEVEVTENKTTIVQFQVGRFEIAVTRANDEPVKDVYYAVYTQRPDAVGNPVNDSRVTDGRTDNRGIGSKWLTPGLYTISMDLRGYNWGDRSEGKGKINVPVTLGTTNQIAIKLGQLIIGLSKPDGSSNTNAYVAIYTQRMDVNNNPVLGERIWEGRTDNGGYATIDLTQGLYALVVEKETLYDIPVYWGKITETDGKTYKSSD